jgi:hypothetical protein
MIVILIPEKVVSPSVLLSGGLMQKAMISHQFLSLFIPKSPPFPAGARFPLEAPLKFIFINPGLE